MERPWLILCRVVHVVQPGADDMHADAEEDAAVGEGEQGPQAQEEEHHVAREAEENPQAQQLEQAVVGEAEEDPQAQQQEHAAVGESEDDLQAQQDQQAAAVGEAEEDPQAQQQEHAAVGEAEDDSQAQQDQQAAAVGEAAEDPQVQLEESVLNVNTDEAASAPAHAAHGAAEPNFIVSVAPPPRVSFLIAGLGSHPDPERPDMYPYVLASGRFCLLVHFSVAPTYGTNFNVSPVYSYLVVVRHFRRADGQIAARAVRVPYRPDGNFAPRYIESIGLACNHETGHCKIAQIMVGRGSTMIVLYFISTEFSFWQGNILESPLHAVDRHRDWVPHGTVAINNTFVWFDLSWGMISCDLDKPPLQQVLVFHHLPQGHAIRGGATADLHCTRCITVSENLVRYVEITLHTHEPATVSMWYRDVLGNPRRWFMNYKEKFEHIWDDASYIDTGLPRNPPMLVGVSPVNSNVVYLALNQQLFGVNVPEHRVVHFEEYEPLNRPGLLNEPISSRYVIPWNLDADVATNVGHQPVDHLIYDDSSSDSGMDDQLPPEPNGVLHT